MNPAHYKNEKRKCLKVVWVWEERHIKGGKSKDWSNRTGGVSWRVSHNSQEAQLGNKILNIRTWAESHVGNAHRTEEWKSKSTREKEEGKE